MTDIKPPHTPHIVERNSGYSEYVLERTRPSRWSEDLPGCSILLTVDGRDFNGVRWPTRQLSVSQPDAAPKPVAGVTDVDRLFVGTYIGDECKYCGRNAKPFCRDAQDMKIVADVECRQAAAPPAPVPAVEAAVFKSQILWAIKQWQHKMTAEELCDAIMDIPRMQAALTAARPSADAGKVTEADELAEWIFQRYIKARPLEAVPFVEMRDKLRAALAARGRS